MTQLDIRQLAEHGGVNPIAPVTVPEAVKFEDGNDLTDFFSGASFTILANGWGNATTINETTYYPYVVNLTSIFTPHPTVGIGAVGDLPTAAEQKAYDLWKYVVIDDEEVTLTLYATSIPTNDFVIVVNGVV